MQNFQDMIINQMPVFKVLELKVELLCYLFLCQFPLALGLWNSSYNKHRVCYELFYATMLHIFLVLVNHLHLRICWQVVLSFEEEMIMFTNPPFFPFHRTTDSSDSTFSQNYHFSYQMVKITFFLFVSHCTVIDLLLCVEVSSFLYIWYISA